MPVRTVSLRAGGATWGTVRSMRTTLIIEDDKDLSEITAFHLRKAEYKTDQAYTLADARNFLEKNHYDLVLLDEVLPDGLGSQMCQSIREQYSCPIIFMSCNDDSDTIISALRSGGDDYMVKPLNYEVLLARADAVIRRSALQHTNSGGTLRYFKHFAIDDTRRQVVRDGVSVELSSIEYALLQYMTQHPNTLLLYHELYQNIWASDSLGDVRTVMVHISNLRKKLDPDRLGIISTVRNAGYIFTDL